MKKMKVVIGLLSWKTIKNFKNTSMNGYLKLLPKRSRFYYYKLHTFQLEFD